jgi:hypothetical protein
MVSPYLFFHFGDCFSLPRVSGACFGLREIEFSVKFQVRATPTPVPVNDIWIAAQFPRDFPGSQRLSKSFQ